ncbi:hypothetical protein [Conexibacter sp. DBS9H8]|uniref:hypothetical protein n=1 Tax=Conexibacter sp. DBS9H8 TaxID=2937801 RepID=UPI00200D8A2E|nr:hypothetical protein [Conexibacter sp. DBS9H8]
MTPSDLHRPERRRSRRPGRCRAARRPAARGFILGVGVGLSVALSGCARRVQLPSLTTPVAPGRFLQIAYPKDGVRLDVPAGWSLTDEPPPLVAVISSGPALIALWHYRRPGSTGASSLAALEVRRAALLAAARRRDPSLQVNATALTHLDGAGAVILDVTGRVGARLRRIRSEHVYLPGAEIVLETYSPPALFPALDRRVFSPVRHSLALLSGGRSRLGAAHTTTVAGAVP